MNINLLKRNSIEDVTESAKKVREEMGLTGTDTEVLLELVRHETAKLNEFVREEEPSEDDRTKAEAAMKAAINLYHDSLCYDRLTELEGMKPSEAWKAYLETQNVKGNTVSFNKNEGAYQIKDAKIYLRPYNVINLLCGSTMPQVMDGCAIVVDNCAKFNFKDDGAYVTKEALDKSYSVLRKRMGWDKFNSKKELARQLTKFCHWIIGDLCPTMHNADVTWIIMSIANCIDKADTAGEYKKRDTKTLLEHTFRAIYTRYHNLPYKWQLNSDDDKVAQYTVANKAMAEAPATKDAMPEVTKEKVITVEKKAGK